LVAEIGMLFEKCLNSVSQTPRLVRSGLAFPNDHDAPAEPAQRALDPLIAGGIPVDLGNPIATPRCRNPASAAGMPVPKATADEDHFAESGEHEVGIAGERADVQTESVAESVGEAGDDD
jgi:hypothetical protein